MAALAIHSSVATVSNASVSNASDSRLSKSNESCSSVTSLTGSSSLSTITPILDSKYKQKCTQEAADIEIIPDAFSETNGRKKRKSNEASKHAQWREVLKAVNLMTSYDDDSKTALVLKGVVDHPKMAKYAKAVGIIPTKEQKVALLNYRQQQEAFNVISFGNQKSERSSK